MIPMKRIKDIIGERRLKGLKVNKPSVFSSGHVVRFEDVVGWGTDAITVADSNVKQRLSQTTDLQVVMNEVKFTGQQLLSPDGNLLGIVHDVLFASDGTLSALEVTNGWMTDILKGRTIVDLPSHMALSERVCVFNYEALNDKY